MSNVVTARVSDEVLALIDRLAVTRERSRAWIVAQLIETAARKQVEFDDFIRVGVEDFEAGRTVPHDQLVTTMRQRYGSRAAA